MSTRRNLLAGAGAALTLSAAGPVRADWQPTRRFADPAIQVLAPASSGTASASPAWNGSPPI